MAHAPMFARAMGLPARLAIYSLTCVALMVLDHRYDAMTAVRTAGATLIHPVQALLARPFEFLGEAGYFFATHGELLREKHQVEAERERLAALLQGYQDLQRDNAHLQAMLRLTPPTATEPVAARITRTLPGPFARKIVVDRGHADGVETGRPVIDLTGLVGQVTEVYPTSSVITLLTSRDQSAPVQNQRNGLRLIVNGVGSDNLLEVRYLDVHADLRAGDILTTSGIDGVYPAGIQVARVVKIEPPRQTPFARAVCEPIGDVGHYRHVLILKAKNLPKPP